MEERPGFLRGVAEQVADDHAGTLLVAQLLQRPHEIEHQLRLDLRERDLADLVVHLPSPPLELGGGDAKGGPPCPGRRIIDGLPAAHELREGLGDGFVCYLLRAAPHRDGTPQAHVLRFEDLACSVGLDGLAHHAHILHPLTGALRVGS